MIILTKGTNRSAGYSCNHKKSSWLAEKLLTWYDSRQKAGELAFQLFVQLSCACMPLFFIAHDSCFLSIVFASNNRIRCSGCSDDVDFFYKQLMTNWFSNAIFFCGPLNDSSTDLWRCCSPVLSTIWRSSRRRPKC